MKREEKKFYILKTKIKFKTEEKKEYHTKPIKCVV